MGKTAQPNKAGKPHLRQCAVCREKRPKEQLLRIVRTPEGAVTADPTGKRNGRGLYLCADKRECLSEAAKRRVIQRSLGCEMPEDLFSGAERLLRIPDEEEGK